MCRDKKWKKMKVVESECDLLEQAISRYLGRAFGSNNATSA